ncbi:MAG: ABC transporter permease [Proteobacteria bacterium]|nr:MAG: ABC transporter permease [Pseudomonadota bacterium]
MQNKGAFTVIELIFVIVVLGILAGIAFPRFAVTRDDAFIVRGKSELSTIRSAISSHRLEKMISGGGTAYIGDENLSSGDKLFSGVLPNPIYEKEGGGRWRRVDGSSNKYIFRAGSGASSDVEFTYNDSDGTFECDHSKPLCKKLAE